MQFHTPSLRHIVAAAALLATVPASQAAGIITFQEVGANVVATGTGSFNTTGFLFNYGTSYAPHVSPGGSRNVVIGGTAGVFGDLQLYYGLTPPTAFGTGGLSLADSASGSSFGVFGTDSLLLPVGYVDGTALSGTATWNNSSFSSMGLTLGTYTYTWGSGATADKLDLVISSAPVTISPVPEPDSAVLALAGLAVVAAGAARRRKA